MTRRLAALVLAAIVALGAAVGLLFGFHGLPFVMAEIAVLAGLFALDRLELPIVDRWDRGAAGEEHVCAVLDELRAAGGVAIHDADLGRGNVDHIVIGPAAS
jgi:Nuclease-related domain